MDGEWLVKGVKIEDAASWPIGKKWDGAILSVPHTGTHTLKKVLNTGHYHTHRQDFFFLLDCLKEVKIAIPIRDPKSVAESWAKRGNVAADQTIWWQAWQNLFHVFERDCTVFKIEGCDVRLNASPSEIRYDLPEYDWIYENEVIREIYGSG